LAIAHQQRKFRVLEHRSNPIPQALQQHGGVPKSRAPELVAPPLQATLEMFDILDRPGPFATPSMLAPSELVRKEAA